MPKVGLDSKALESWLWDLALRIKGYVYPTQ